MKQADSRILAELKGISAAYASGINPSLPPGTILALEEQTDAMNWAGLLRTAGSQVDGHPNRIIVQRYPPDRINASTQYIGAGTLRLCAAYLPKQKLISGVKWFQTVAGSAIVATDYNGVGLYSYTAGQNSITRRALSANDPNLWQAFVGSGVYGNASFVTPYLAPAGIYYGAMLGNGTGNFPFLGGHNIFNGGVMGGNTTLFGDAGFLSVASINTQLSLAGSYLLSSFVAVANPSYNTWMALY